MSGCDDCEREDVEVTDYLFFRSILGMPDHPTRGTSTMVLCWPCYRVRDLQRRISEIEKAAGVYEQNR